MYSRRACVLYRWIKEYDLVLYTDLVDDRLQRHVAFQELYIAMSIVSRTTQQDSKSYLLLFSPLVFSLFAECVSNRYMRRVVRLVSECGDIKHRGWRPPSNGSSWVFGGAPFSTGG